MGIAAERVFKLSNFPGSLGLRCDERGLELAGVPLLNKADRRFIPRPADEIERLLASVYGAEVFSEGVMKRLQAVARALNAGDIGLAMTAAVLLKFPEPDWSAAVRIAQTDTFLKYDPDESRDWHGRWTTGNGGEATKPKAQLLSSLLQDRVKDFVDAYEQRRKPFEQDQQPPESEAKTSPFSLLAGWVHLPDGDRNDELGDLLEAIANAKLSDVPRIAKDIDRQFVQTGDLDDALKLWGALHDIATRDTRRQVTVRRFSINTNI